MRIQRTSFSENYSRKFARSIAHVLTKVKYMKEMPILCWEETAFAMQGTKRVSSQGPSFQAKRAKLQNSSLIEPKEMPAKRRRVHEKSQEQANNQDLCERICSKVSSIAPRVGRQEIMDTEITQDIQELFHHEMIVRVVVCKGTERTIVPPKEITPSEAPYRRAIIVQRSASNQKGVD